jgi:anti-sigma factor RsiW
VSVFYWLDSNLDYALAGEVSRQRLLEVATVVYKQLRNL